MEECGDYRDTEEKAPCLPSSREAPPPLRKVHRGQRCPWTCVNLASSSRGAGLAPRGLLICRLSPHPAQTTWKCKQKPPSTSEKGASHSELPSSPDPSTSPPQCPWPHPCITAQQHAPCSALKQTDQTDPVRRTHTDRTLGGSQESILSPGIPKSLLVLLKETQLQKVNFREKLLSPEYKLLFKKSTREKQRGREAVFPDPSLPGTPPATH